MKQTKTIIYGGSFDPVHKGHLDIIKNLVKLFDKVIIMPAFMSPHKKSHDYAAPQHRLKMIELALEEENIATQNIELSTYELDKQTTNYTIDTVQFLKEKYPNSQLYFCIGSENLSALNQWKSVEALNTLAIFFVIPRPNFVAIIPNDLNAQIASFSGLDTSSSLIKALIS